MPTNWLLRISQKTESNNYFSIHYLPCPKGLSWGWYTILKSENDKQTLARKWSLLEIMHYLHNLQISQLSSSSITLLMGRCAVINFYKCTVPSYQSYSRRVPTGHSANTAFLSLARFWRTAGLKITADRRTMSGLIAYLTGQTLVLPVILTGHLWICTFYFPYSCRLMLHNAAMISIFFAFFAALLLQKDSASIE